MHYEQRYTEAYDYQRPNHEWSQPIAIGNVPAITTSLTFIQLFCPVWVFSKPVAERLFLLVGQIVFQAFYEL
jgi:hypothetical protein